MKRLALLFALALPAPLWTGCADQSQPLEPEVALAAARGAHVVRVAAPTGDVATDRASILAALEQVRHGGTIQFAPGEYAIGLAEPFSFIPITVPRVALLGHPAGTTLRGCNPEEIQPGFCQGLLLSGGRQTVRNVDFVDMHFAIILGRLPFMEPDEDAAGGYRIEGNSFRNSFGGVIAVGPSQPSVVRHNTFQNVGQAVFFFGGTFHVVDNEISASQPELIPVAAEGFSGVLGLAFDRFATGPCDHNVIARNRIEGYRWGAGLEVIAGETCSHNLIRANTIVDSRIFAGFDLGAPVFVWNESDQAELMEHNLIQGNWVRGAEGVGVVILRASRTRVVNNRIGGITLSPVGDWLGAGNGSGIWVSPGSSRNQILANTFAAIASYEVVLEGDRNHVATTSRSDVVRDLGLGNRVTGPGSVVTSAALGGASAAVAPAVAERTEAVRMLSQRFRASSWWLVEDQEKATPR